MKKLRGQLDIRPPNLKIGGDVSPPHPPRIDAPDLYIISRQIAFSSNIENFTLFNIGQFQENQM